MEYKSAAHPIASLMNTDMIVMPKPLPATKIISTSSRFRLKYCPTIRAAGSLAIPTPTPEIS